MSLQALLLGSRLKAAVTALLVVTATVGGAWALGVVGTPNVASVDNRFGDANQQRTVIHTDLVVNNPNPVGVQLDDTRVNYTIAMNNVSIANGTKRGLQVDPGNTTLEFSTQMRNEKIPAWWVTHVRNGERTEVQIDAQARTGLLGGRVFPFEETKEVETDIIGQFNSNETRPVNAERPPPTADNPVLYVNSTRASWGRATETETPIDMRFEIYNPNLQPYTVTEIGYEISMNGIQVGEGQTRESPAIIIPSQSTETLDTWTVIDNPTLDEWWVSHLQNDQVTDLRIDFYAVVELPGGQTVRAPLDELTYEKRIETDVFGNENESRDGGSGTPTTAPTATPTESDGIVTTPTDTEILGGTETLLDNETATPTDGVLGAFEARPVG